MNTNKTHYSEADLLETYYTQPGESMPVMMHLASCEDCAARYDKLERKLREAAACSTEKPDSFWARQRLSIMRKLPLVQKPQVRNHGPARIAAAAVLAFVLGGAFVYEVRRREPMPVTPPAQTATATKSADDLQVPRDPWQSEELQDFQPIVEWESWVSDGL
jgi:hypothetical protein